MRKLIIGVMGCALMFGCATASSTSKSGGEGESASSPKELGVAAVLKFDDVPIPSGFRMLPDQSFSFQNDVTRVGILKYAGRANAQRVIHFYQEQMPIYQWQFINLIEYDKSLLNFEKMDQVCTVTVEGGITKTNLVIAIAPKGSARSSYESKRNERKILDKK